jgi:hypothetical protein
MGEYSKGKRKRRKKKKGERAGERTRGMGQECSLGIWGEIGTADRRD